MSLARAPWFVRLGLSAWALAMALAFTPWAPLIETLLGHLAVIAAIAVFACHARLPPSLTLARSS
jgi:hypothetical protein